MTAGRLQSRRITRRQLLKGAGATASAALLGGGAFAAVELGADRSPEIGGRPLLHPASPWTTYRSRPDLRPPAVVARGEGSASGYLFLGPGSIGGSQSGPLIADHDGALVWFKPLRWPLWTASFTPSQYRGRPVLTWWEGEVILPLGYGKGEGVIVDHSYREIARVRAANGRQMDVHEFRITPEGTALFACYPQTVRQDLSGIGGPRDGSVLEAVIQEIDLLTGRLLLEWRSLDHVPVSDSYRRLAEPYDYLHVNSISIAPDGNLLISARHTWTLYKLDRRTGAVIWRLGGKRNQFEVSSEARFTWQHDARYRAADRITLFDNGSDGRTTSERQSRGVVLAIDDRRRTAQLAEDYRHPSPLLSASMGNLQVLPGGNTLVGWGSQPYITEFTGDGDPVAEVALVRGQQSYRAFREPWHGAPPDRPAVAVHRDRNGHRVLYASWNGATEVARWQLHIGSDEAALVPVSAVARTGFETPIPIGSSARFAMVTALDGASRALGRSPTVKL